MKRQKRKIVVCALVVIMLSSIVALTSRSKVYGAEASGTDGEIAWEINGNVLKLSAVEGTQGRMVETYGYDEEENAPWMRSPLIENVKHIYVTEGVTSLTSEAFSSAAYKLDCSVMTIAGTVEKIPSCLSRESITEIIFEEGVKEISYVVVLGKTTTIHLPKSLEKIEEAAFYIPADGSTTFLQRVHGYKGSVAEEYVKLVNKSVTETRENGSTADGSMIGIATDNSMEWSDTVLVDFVPIDGEGEDIPNVDGEIRWIVEGNTLTFLAVEGTQGRMRDYSPTNESPWQSLENKDEIKKIVIDDSVTKLGAWAFDGTYEVEVMDIPGSVKRIPGDFARNLKIGELIIHEGVEEIEECAFMHSQIPEARIPVSVKTIGEDAFITLADSSGTFLERVYGYSGSAAEQIVETYNTWAVQDRENTAYGFFVCGDWSDTALIEFIPLNEENCGTDGEIAWEINEDVLTLTAVEGTQGRMKDYSMQEETPWQKIEENYDIRKIVIDNSVTSLGRFGLYGIWEIESLEIAGSMEVIPSGFAYAMDIDELIIHEGVVELEDLAFINGEILNVRLPASVEQIGEMVFCGVGDGNMTYLQKVYGYSGDVAEQVVEQYNTWAMQTRENGETEMGTLFGICEEGKDVFSDTALIEFVSLASEEEEITGTPTEKPDKKPADETVVQMPQKQEEEKILDDTPKTGSGYEPLLLLTIALGMFGMGLLFFKRREF